MARLRAGRQQPANCTHIVMFSVTVWLTRPVEVASDGSNKSKHVCDTIILD